MWRLERTADGAPTLVHPLHGERCHPREGAWTQARERYARACRLAERARELPPGGRLRLLDLGTGLGLNLAAALAAVAESGRPDVALEAVTLEREREPLERALVLGPELAEAPAELCRAHAPVRRALALALASARPGSRVPLCSPDGRGRPGSLELLLGDASLELERLADRRFDAVFLDPFSPRVEPDSWRPAFLARLARLCAPGAWLSTYSAATEVRAALAAAGLSVGAGGRVGNKREGTLASPDRAPPPLEARVARRVLRRAELLRLGAASSVFPAAPCGGPGPGT